MTSPTLLEAVEPDPTAWLRFWFPDPGGSDVEHQRAYTFSEADPAAGSFAVDFVLHEPAGPASAWAQRAEPGAAIAVSSLGSSRFEVPEEPPAGYLVVGDSASIPAISSILRTVPAEIPLEVDLEEHSAEDRLIPLPDHPRSRVHWVPRRGATSLAAAIEARDWSDWSAWLAPESSSLKHLRVRLRDEFGFPRSELHAQAYWMHGRAMGTLRSTGAEEAGEAETVEEAAPQAADAAPPAEAPPAPSRGRWRARAGGRFRSWWAGS